MTRTSLLFTVLLVVGYASAFQPISRLAPLALSSSTRLLAAELVDHAVVEESASFLSNIPILDSVLHEPVVWSSLCMLSIVSLLLTWEESVKNIRKGLPEPLMPVLDSMLAEVGGLGFIGLFLSTFVTGGLLGGMVENLSESFLGNEEILLETFEFLHTAFFQIGVGFFVVAGLTVADVLWEINKLSDITNLSTLDTDGDGEVSLSELADALGCGAVVLDENGDGQLDEDECTNALRQFPTPNVWERLWGSTQQDVSAEALVIREQMIRKFDLPADFEVETYIGKVFGHNLDEIVELSPVTWLPLIPLFALANSIDLSHDVVSAASSNGFVTAGEFITNPWVVYSRIVLQIMTLVWSLFNYWKLTSIKNMLVATLVRAGGPTGPAILLRPRFYDDELRAQFNSSPGWAAPIERALTKGRPARNIQEELFGAAGADGPALYRNSIKFHTWLCVAQIVFMTSEIVLRDVNALLAESTVMAHPEAVFPEEIFFGFFVAVSIGQLALAPRTFLSYSACTSIELMTKEWALKAALEESKIEEWKEEQGDDDEACGLVGYRKSLQEGVTNLATYDGPILMPPANNDGSSAANGIPAATEKETTNAQL